MSTKQEWGNACWYLFHSLASNIINDSPKLIQELLDNIILICNNLPCPDCSYHASKTLKTLQKSKLKTKDDLIKVLWEFHNTVNKRLHKKTFSKDEYNELYSRANLINIYKHFMSVMNKKNGNEKAMIYTLSRRNALKKLSSFVITHSSHFIITK